MILGRIRLQNFWSYFDETVELANQGLCLVKGTNGAGKSAVVRALLFCLFGTGADSVVNNLVKAGTCVTLTGYNGGDVFKIQRYRQHKKHKNNVYFFINDVPVETATNRDAQEKIDQYIGCDSRSFLNIASFSSDMLMFASATDSERKAIFEKILQDLEVYNEYHQQAKDELEELRDKRSKCERNIEIEERELDLVTKFLADEENRLAEMEECRAEELKKKKKKYGDLTAELNQMLRLREKIVRYKNAEGRLHHFFEGMEDRSNAWANNRGEIEMWKQYIDTLDQGQCMYCHQDITASHSKKEKKRARQEIKKLEAIDKDLTTYCDKWDKVKDKLWKLESKIERMEYKLTKYDGLIDEMSLISEDMEELRKGPDRKSIQKWKKKIKQVGKNIFMFNNEIAAIDDKLVYLEEVAKGFSKTGIPNVIIARALTMLEERTNEYLDTLTSGSLGVTFTGFKLTKKGGVRNKIGINVVSESGVTAYGSYSGGERQRLNVAILLALRDVAEYSKGIKLNCLFLDEVLDLSLDEEGIEEVLGLLQTKKSAVDSIFVISPKASMLYNTAIEFDNVYTVAKVGGVSSYGV